MAGTAVWEFVRRLGGGGGGEGGPCSDPDSFLGVANAQCIGANGKTSTALVALIFVLSYTFEWAAHKLKHMYTCPQVSAIIQQLFAEMMILGFVSMTFFVMQVNGITAHVAKLDDLLNGTELFHFMEFFHYAVFITMLFYIAQVAWLFYLSTKLPKLYQRTENRERAREGSADSHASAQAPLDLGDVKERSSSAASEASAASSSSAGSSTLSTHSTAASMTRTEAKEKYLGLKAQRRERGWHVKASPRHWWNWWLAVMRMGYVMARKTCRPIYENRELMGSLFGTSVHETKEPSYRTFNQKGTRALLVELIEIHWTTWVLLLCLAGINATRKKVDANAPLTEHNSYGNVVVMVEFGAAFFLWSLILFVKTFLILMGVVNTKLKERQGGNNPVTDSSSSAGGGTRGRSASAPENVYEALEIFKNSKVHLPRFWFRSPRLLVRQVQTIIFTQAIYTAVVMLMFRKDGAKVGGGSGLFFMLLWPFLIISVVVPFMLLTLTIVFNVIGYVGTSQFQQAADPRHGHHDTHSTTEAKQIKRCPNCGSDELTEDHGTFVCGNCGTMGIPSTMEVVAEEHDDHGGDQNSDHGMLRSPFSKLVSMFTRKGARSGGDTQAGADDGDDDAGHNSTDQAVVRSADGKVGHLQDDSANL